MLRHFPLPFQPLPVNPEKTYPRPLPALINSARSGSNTGHRATRSAVWAGSGGRISLLRERRSAAAEVAWFRRACRASQGPFLAAPPVSRANAKRRSREGPPAVDSLVSPPGIMRSRPKTTACCRREWGKPHARCGTPEDNRTSRRLLRLHLSFSCRRPWGSENPRRPRRLSF